MTAARATRVAVMGGMRTPFSRAGTAFKKYSPLQLAVHSVNGLLEKQQFDPQSIDELVYGVVLVDPRLPHLAREVVFASELPAKVRALTVTDNCIRTRGGRRRRWHRVDVEPGIAFQQARGAHLYGCSGRQDGGQESSGISTAATVALWAARARYCRTLNRAHDG
jgi:hypothetical protein